MVSSTTEIVTSRVPIAIADSLKQEAIVRKTTVSKVISEIIENDRVLRFNRTCTYCGARYEALKIRGADDEYCSQKHRRTDEAWQHRAGNNVP